MTLRRRAVAREAGVAAGTVYLYFRSKDDLLVSIFERTFAFFHGLVFTAGTWTFNPATDRLVLEVFSPDGTRVGRFHLELL